MNVTGLEGNELAADDYTRKSLPQGHRWGDAWDVFKSNFFKLILLNIFVLITFVPGIVIMYFRGSYITGMGLSYPFNTSIGYPFYPDINGLTEGVTMSADLMFFSLLIVAGFVASLGISGAAYSIKKLLNTHGEFTIKGFFHGIKTCYFNTVFPVTIFMVFLFLSVILGDRKDLIYAVGGNRGAAVTAQVFMLIATVLVALYCAFVFAVGTSYHVKILQLVKNSFVIMIGAPLHMVFMAAFTCIPVWLFLAGGIARTISFVLFIFIGFSYMLLCWTAFTQWLFDMYVNPNLKAVENAKPQKSDKEIAADKREEDQRAARELLAAGKSELVARPIMPIAETSGAAIPATFTRANLSAAEERRKKLGEEVSSYEKAHENDPEFAEYRKLFAERDKALQSDDKKGKKGKKISSENLLK